MRIRRPALALALALIAAAARASAQGGAAVDPPTLEARVARLEAEQSAAPWWRSGLFSGLLGALLGGASTFYFSRRSEKLAREKDNLAAAIKLAEEWRGLNDKIGKARGLMAAPAAIAASAADRNLVIDYGNWLDLMAVRWRRGFVDAPFLVETGLDKRAQEFWREFDAARVALAAHNPPFDLERYQREWPALRKLATGA
ncbi:MAG: hypothetical protein IPL88_07330 [Rhizobiales bacterium]|nr:hypothetical protein [Hyphomicrobiales bacterium]